MKPTIATAKTRLLRDTVFLALLFLVVPVTPRALGEEQTGARNGAARCVDNHATSTAWRLHAATAGIPMAPMPPWSWLSIHNYAVGQPVDRVAQFSRLQ